MDEQQHKPTGLIYNKMPKAASTSTASVVLRIAHSVARKKFGSIEETALSNATMLPCSRAVSNTTIMATILLVFGMEIGTRHGRLD